MTALELNNGALKLHRDRYDDPTESTLVNALWACEERDTYMIGEPWSLDPYGGVVTLQPHAPEEWEREEIARENGEEVTA